MIFCFYCELSFHTLSTLMLHITLKHKTSKYSQVRCNFTNCFKTYANVYSLKHHLIRDHQIELVKHSCHNNDDALRNNDNKNTTICTNIVLAKLRDSILTNNEMQRNIKVTDISSNPLLPLNFLDNNLNNCEDMDLLFKKQ